MKDCVKLLITFFIPASAGVYLITCARAGWHDVAIGLALMSIACNKVL